LGFIFRARVELDDTYRREYSRAMNQIGCKGTEIGCKGRSRLTC
jgi:hypothetical protein